MKYILTILLVALSTPSFAKLQSQARIDSLKAESHDTENALAINT